MKKITPCNLLRVTEKHKKTYHIQSLGTGIVVALQSSEATNIELATGCNSWLSIWCHSSKDSLIDHVPVTLKWSAFGNLWKSTQLISASASIGFQRSVMKVRPPPGGPIADAMTLDSWKSTSKRYTEFNTEFNTCQIETYRNLSKSLSSSLKFNEVHWSSWSVPFVSILAYFTRASSCTAHANLSMVNMFDFLLAGTLIG